ncbi:MAG: prolipoprotein diacylglyceryl transferase [Eubacteriales bacterium]|nr:prolipoprotein diacylglyceryl transferase [Eubacteriales bacterium]
MGNGADLLFPHLGIVIEKMVDHFTVFGFEVKFYGLIIGMAFLIGMFICEWDAKRRGQNADDYWDCFILMAILGVIGARLYYVLFSWSYYSQNPGEILNIRGGGLAIYGAVIGGAIGVFIVAHKKKRNGFEMLDSIMPALLFGQVMGRWGNFFNCEAFGEYTDSLLAMRIKKSLVYPDSITALMKENLIVENGIEYIQVHPTFLYESLWNLVSIFIVLWYGKRVQKFKGEIVCLYMVTYGIGRSIIEGLRTDSLYVGNTGIRVSQLLSMFLVVIGAGVIIYNRFVRKSRAEVAATETTKATAAGEASAEENSEE